MDKQNLTATNVFAHIENIHDIVEDILLVLEMKASLFQNHITFCHL